VRTASHTGPNSDAGRLSSLFPRAHARRPRALRGARLLLREALWAGAAPDDGDRRILLSDADYRRARGARSTVLGASSGCVRAVQRRSHLSKPVDALELVAVIGSAEGRCARSARASLVSWPCCLTLGLS